MKVRKGKKSKRTLFFVLSMAGLLLAGCGGDKARETGKGTNVPEDTLLGYTYSKVYTPYQLSSCDVKVEIMEAESEEVMATKLLAGDSDFDFMVLSSDSRMASDIRRTGAYYELNDIPEVVDLLDKYHGYIEEAAMAENGDFWMIPCGMDMPFLLYQENLCEEYGLDFTDMTYAEFMEKVEVLPKNSDHTFRVPYYLMTGDITDKFERMYGYENLNEKETELLRSYMEKIRGYDVPIREGMWWLFSSEESASYLSKESVQNIVFKMERSFNVVNDTSMQYFFRCDGFRAMKTPDLERGVSCPNSVIMTFIIINPKSAKLDLTLEYVSRLCEKLQTDTSLPFRLMFQGEDFSDNVLREDIYRLLSDGEVNFPYPYDVIGAELWAYRDGKQEFDAMLEEMKRNLKMYYNE